MKQQIRFVPKDKSKFFATLRSRIDNYFTDNNLSKHANSEMVVKSIVLLGGYIFTFAFMLFLGINGWSGYLLWALMGVFCAGIGMSVMHDANHGAYSKKQEVNDWIGYSLNLVGGAVTNWKLQHNILHHTYTNVPTHDDDIQNRAILRFNPQGKSNLIHKFQFVYAFFFYGILTLYWVTLKDLVQLIKFKKDGVSKATDKELFVLFLKMSMMKIAYFSAMLLLPVYVFGFSWTFVLTGFLLLHFVTGLILTVIFQLAHSVEGTTHPMPDSTGIIENDWAIHQMHTTVNFSRHNKWLSWYVGGLNFQVEHHLFPRICHVHYPALAHIVKETAEEFGIPYLENHTFGQALNSHIALLQRMGLPELNEAIA